MEESIGFLKSIQKSFELKEVDIRTYSPLTLAYIGDAVYDLIFRTVVVEKGNMPPNKLHRHTVQYVKAPAQALLIEAVMDRLTPEEFAVYKRGRNAKSYTMAKNATPVEYRKATGLEALVGYLYLTDQTNRILELIQIGLHNNEDKENSKDKESSKDKEDSKGKESSKDKEDSKGKENKEDKERNERSGGKG